MTRPRATARRAPAASERGLVKLLAVLVLASVVLLAGGGVYGYERMSSTPDLGAPPRGPAHGSGEAELAVYAVSQLSSLLEAGGRSRATVVLSEQDLVLEARLHAGQALADPQVRVRGGRVILSGRTTVLGVGVVAVGHLRVRLTRGDDGLPDVGVDIDEIDAGDLRIPGFLRDAIATQIDRQVRLQSLLSADPTLRLLRGQLDCVAAGGAGLVLGFHGPLAPADGAGCAST